MVDHMLRAGTDRRSNIERLHAMEDREALVRATGMEGHPEFDHALDRLARCRAVAMWIGGCVCFFGIGFLAGVVFRIIVGG